MAWDTLLSIYQDATARLLDERARRPEACPNDGEPLRTGPDGVLWCPYDGWRDEGTCWT